jgi:hypothetical protein
VTTHYVRVVAPLTLYPGDDPAETAALLVQAMRHLLIDLLDGDVQLELVRADDVR